MFDIEILAFMLLLHPQPTIADLHFAYAQEAFVSHAGFKPPAKIQEAIEQLGDDEYCCREVASRRLRKLDARWIMWGLWSPDIEARLRANTVLKVKTKCNRCGGNGFCRFSSGKDSDGYSVCRNCGKSGWYHLENEDGSRDRAGCPFCMSLGTTWKHSLFDIPAR